MDGRYALSGGVHTLVQWIHLESLFPDTRYYCGINCFSLVRWTEVFSRETADCNTGVLVHGFSNGRKHIFPPSFHSREMTPGLLTKHVLASLDLSTVLAQVDWEQNTRLTPPPLCKS